MNRSEYFNLNFWIAVLSAGAIWVFQTPNTTNLANILAIGGSLLSFYNVRKNKKHWLVRINHTIDHSTYYRYCILATAICNAS